MSFVQQHRRWIGAGRLDCVARKGMVASKHQLIGKAGIDVLKKGGNAVDAAVAAAFVDCVVEPAMNGLGGEGVMAIHLSSGENIIIDYVGRPAESCTPDMYELDYDKVTLGQYWWRVAVKNEANRFGHKACTTPGTVAGLCAALDRYGTMNLKEIMDPAIKIAKEGFIVGWDVAHSIFNTMRSFSIFPEWKKIFLYEGKFPYLPYSLSARRPPELLINKDLAKSLGSIAEGGPDVFYKGWIANAISKEMEQNDGFITLEDLGMYQPIIHEPELGNYREHEVVYDPTHAGTTLMEILNILEGYDLNSSGFGSAETLHLIAEAVGLAFADRFKYLGDPGYVDVPQEELVSKEYAEARRGVIDVKRAAVIESGNPWKNEPECTTALAVADSEGNLVAINQTIVSGFGSGVVIPSTGIVMNNAMWGLNPEPGYTNSIDGRKRRIQNVCPTILLKEGDQNIAIGAPGGRSIMVSIAHVIINIIDMGMSIQEAFEAPRVMRETFTIYMDNRLSAEVKDELIKMGHDVVWIDKELYNWARPVGVLINPKTGLIHGGVDPTYESTAIGY